MDKDYSLCVIGEDPDFCPLGNDCLYYSFIEDRCRYHETRESQEIRQAQAVREADKELDYLRK